jgi:hypothetical protein
VVVVDVREQPPPETGTRDRPERRSGGTSEMLALGSTGQDVRTPPRSTAPPRSPRRSARAARRKRSRGFRNALGNFVRGLAVVVVLLLALTPAYLWGSSRYFFEFDQGEVVAYQGVPYDLVGIELNREWRRPGLTESEIKDPYKGPIESHKLYTKDQIERVLEDLGR